jgi:hypothetical protein
VSVPLIVMMLVAMFTVHLRYGFSAINTIGLTADGPQFSPPGYEVNLLYIAGLLALILGGAGPLAIDGLLTPRKRDPAVLPSRSGSHGVGRPNTASARCPPALTQSADAHCPPDPRRSHDPDDESGPPDGQGP